MNFCPFFALPKENLTQKKKKILTFKLL